MNFDFYQVLSAFVVLFVVVDPLGNLPIILSLESRGIKVNAWKVTIWSEILMLLFFFLGEGVLRFFDVDISSFAVAGSIVLFIMALEMLLDVEIFKNNAPDGSGSIVPLAFPLFAGPAVFTSLLTIRSEYEMINIVVTILLMAVIIFVDCYFTKYIKKWLGDSGIYITRKFFGIILMAISVKIFASNLSTMLQ